MRALEKELKRRKSLKKKVKYYMKKEEFTKAYLNFISLQYTESLIRFLKKSKGVEI